MKDFIPYEQALELKELGFDEPCLGRHYYKESYPMLNPNSGEIELVFEFGQYVNQTEVTILAPLKQQAFRWFREKHGICSWIQRLYNEYGNPYYTIIHEYKTDLLSRNHTVVANLKEYNTYEEAEQACLDKLIEIVKTK